MFGRNETTGQAAVLKKTVGEELEAVLRVATGMHQRLCVSNSRLSSFVREITGEFGGGQAEKPSPNKSATGFVPTIQRTMDELGDELARMDRLVNLLYRESGTHTPSFAVTDFTFTQGRGKCDPNGSEPCCR